MKTYARQIPPEYQESPLMLDEIFPDNLIVTGNRDFQDHTTPEYDHIDRYLEEMAGEWENANYWYVWNAETRRYDEVKKSRPEIDGEPYSLRELLRDYGFNRPDGAPWTTKQRHAWRLILEDNRPTDYITDALELLTGKRWDTTTIRGCCQGDWQNVLYPVDEWTREDLDMFETEYFNTGSEWMIHDEDTEPEDAEDISGYCMYCYGWNADQIREEIARETGCKPEDVVLYEYAGSYSVPKYEIA
jgi:hypothetical protein